MERNPGGVYGAKIIRNAQISCAYALACHKLNRSTRFVMMIESNMQLISKRFFTHQEYNRIIQYFDSKHWGNSRCNFNKVVVVKTIYSIKKVRI